MPYLRPEKPLYAGKGYAEKAKKVPTYINAAGNGGAGMPRYRQNKKQIRVEPRKTAPRRHGFLKPVLFSGCFFMRYRSHCTFIKLLAEVQIYRGLYKAKTERNVV